MENSDLMRASSPQIAMEDIIVRKPLLSAELSFGVNLRKCPGLKKAEGDDFVDAYGIWGMLDFDLEWHFKTLYVRPGCLKGELWEKKLNIYLDDKLAFSLAAWLKKPVEEVAVALDMAGSMKIEFEGFDDDFGVIADMTIEYLYPLPREYDPTPPELR